MSRRMTAAVCLAFGLLLAPGVALADPPRSSPSGSADAPGGRGASGDQGRGDVCRHRGEPPCHTTTGVTTTTTDLSGTSATSTTTTTADVSGTTATSTTTGVSGTTATSATSTTTATSGTATSTTGTSATGASTPGTSTADVGGTTTTVPAGARPPSSEGHGLAHTGAAPLWAGLGGLVALLAGAVLLLVSRRRRA